MPDEVSRNDYLILEKDYKNLENKFESINSKLDEVGDRFINANQTITRLQEENLRLAKEKEAMRQQCLREISEFQTKTHQSIDACKLILTEIADSDTAHWQKKENIRMAIGILKKFKIENNGFIPFTWEED